MTRNNKRKEHGAGRGRQFRAGLLLMAMLLSVMAAGCSKEPAANPTETPTETVTPEPTKAETPTEAVTPEPTKAVMPTGEVTPEPTSAPTPTPSVTDGRVIFTGNTVEISEAGVGDTVRFGSYEQDNDESNGAEAIEWLVLDEQDGKLLLLSKDALDCKKYDETHNRLDVTWETCTLRSWLNGTFYDTAFSQTEQERIATTKVRNEGNPKYSTESGNDTEDKVFLLSIGEATSYFDPDLDAEVPERCAKVTAYAEAQGGYVAKDPGSAGNGCWWLRSPGSRGFLVAGVSFSGYIDIGGDNCNYRNVVRPAFWLNPES